jgi:hypothetical protein
MVIDFLFLLYQVWRATQMGEAILGLIYAVDYSHLKLLGVPNVSRQPI